MITRSMNEFYTYYACKTALLPFFAGGFTLDHEAHREIQNRAKEDTLCDLGHDRYLVVIEMKGYDKYSTCTTKQCGLRLHLTGIIQEGKRYSVFEAETVERLASQIDKYPLAKQIYLKRPVLGDWLRQLGVKE